MMLAFPTTSTESCGFAHCRGKVGRDWLHCTSGKDCIPLLVGKNLLQFGGNHYPPLPFRHGLVLRFCDEENNSFTRQIVCPIYNEALNGRDFFAPFLSE